MNTSKSTQLLQLCILAFLLLVDMGGVVLLLNFPIPTPLQGLIVVVIYIVSVVIVGLTTLDLPKAQENK